MNEDTKTHDDQCAMADKILEGVQELQAELAQLRRWKAEAMEVMPDFQAIGKALGVPLGATVHDKILEGIQALQSVLMQERERAEKLGKELDAVRLCFSEASHNDCQAGHEIKALQAEVAALRASLESALEYFADREDADHNGSRFVGNLEMKMAQEIREALSSPPPPVVPKADADRLAEAISSIVDPLGDETESSGNPCAAPNPIQGRAIAKALSEYRAKHAKGGE